MTFSRYPEYRDSGVEWLGEVPAHWRSSKVKYDSYVKARVGWHGLNSDEFTDEGPYLVTGSDFKNRTVDWENCYRCTLERFEQDQYIQLKEGDLLITKDGTIGKLILVEGIPDAATLNSGIFVVRPLEQRYTTQFYFWLLQSCVFYDFIAINKTGSTIVHLYQETFENLPYALPSIGEQTKIAAYLDYETSCIDALIAEQQRLIELLKEKHQAVISHAVTKGLDPSVSMKNSGAEWLGEVPAHWEVKAISKTINKITNGYVGPTRDILVESGVEYVQATHIKNGQVNFDGAYFVTEEWSRKHAKSILQNGDVLVVQTGAGTGDIGLVTKREEGYNCHALIILQSRPDMLIGEYLALVLQSTYGQSKLYSIRTGGMHPHLNCGEVKFVGIPVPPKSEQSEICAFLRDATKKYSHLFSGANQQIKLLTERRSALVSAAITGKIDVRN